MPQRYTAVMLLVTQPFLLCAQADDSAELAKKAQNPIVAMYSLPVQYNLDPVRVIKHAGQIRCK